MRRAHFLTTLLGTAALPALANVPLPARGASAPDVELPAVFHGGRPFLNLTASDGSKILAWLDTNGSGFVSKTLVDRLHLPASGGRAPLPKFVQNVPTLAADAMLPVVDTVTPNDPILTGVDVQLGASWFAGRVWSIDYRNQRMIWHPDNHSLTDDAIVSFKMIFPNGPYPVIPVVVAGELFKMDLDTAASVVDRRGSVTATSFITHARFDKWHKAHPDWMVQAISPGVDRIDVPEVNIAKYPVGGVSFTTRPSDDVFEGESVDGKLGSNAWSFSVLMLDYIRSLAGIA